MAREKKRSDECGVRDRGRLTLHRHEAEVIRAWMRVLIGQVTRSLETYREALRKAGSPANSGQTEYWANALSYLNGVYRRGTASVPMVEWLVEWTHVTTVERHAGADAETKEQPALPGM